MGLLCAINRIMAMCYNYLIMYRTSLSGSPRETNARRIELQSGLHTDFHRGVVEWLVKRYHDNYKPLCERNHVVLYIYLSYFSYFFDFH